MKLHYQLYGEGRPLIILHGLFGLSDNWVTFSKTFSSLGYACYALDLRNHGRSPHSEEFNYTLMAEDLREFMDDRGLAKAIVLGHSMGGKTAIAFAATFPERVERLIVVDIAPRYYPPHHQAVLAALHAVDLESIVSRKEAEAELRAGLQNEATIQFLLKNLYWKTETRLGWRFNLGVLEKHVETVGESFPMAFSIDIPVLFVRGERSGYITEKDEQEIKQHFSNVKIVTVPAAGHWVHADNPSGFASVVRKFLEENTVLST